MIKQLSACRKRHLSTYNRDKPMRDHLQYLRYLIVATLVLFVGGCGDIVFEKLMFSPAMQLPQDENPCDHFPAGYSCELTDFDETFFNSLDNQTRLHALFFKNPESEKLIIYFHGNGSQIYFRIRYALKLVKMANVLLLSYRGYGKSDGNPSEKGLYEDAAAAIDYARHTLQFKETNIYIYGRSLGGAVAIEAAQNRNFAGLILISTFSSGYDVAADRGLESWLGSSRPFDSINKLQNIYIPMLIIHGNRDGLIPIAHGKKLYAAYSGADKSFYEVNGASHWGISRNPEFWTTLDIFVNERTEEADTEIKATREIEATPSESLR